MRVLWASLHRPDPRRGGGWTYLHELLVETAGRHEITLVTTPPSPGDPPLETLEAAGVETVVAACARSPARSRLTLLGRAIAGPGPTGFTEVAPCVEAIARELAAIESRRRFDVVTVFAGELAPAMRAANAPSALLLTDAYIRQGPRAISSAPTVRQRLLRTLDAIHTRRWERTRYRPAAEIACVSEEDAAAIRAVTGRQTVHLIPPPIGDEFFAPPDRSRRDDLVSFIAALDYGPNIDALAWFLDECWPLVKQGRPHSELRVVGRAPGAEVREAIARHDVELRADVPDILPEYWEASVVALPVRLGSGIKTKTLHTLATAAPMVGTPVAFEGLPLRHEEHVLISDDARGLADAMIAALDDPNAARARAARARPIAERYRRRAVGALLERFWEAAAAHPRRD